MAGFFKIFIVNDDRAGRADGRQNGPGQGRAGVADFLVQIFKAAGPAPGPVLNIEGELKRDLMVFLDFLRGFYGVKVEAALGPGFQDIGRGAIFPRKRESILLTFKC